MEVFIFYNDKKMLQKPQHLSHYSELYYNCNISAVALTYVFFFFIK